MASLLPLRPDNTFTEKMIARAGSPLQYECVPLSILPLLSFSTLLLKRVFIKRNNSREG